MIKKLYSNLINSLNGLKIVSKENSFILELVLGVFLIPYIFLKSIKKNFESKTIISLEFRTIKDVLMKKGKKLSKYERLTDHYRRFIDTKKFENKLKKLNYRVLYKKQGINLSKSPNDNPHLCRIVFCRI